jgi:hypothetical protein
VASGNAASRRINSGKCVRARVVDGGEGSVGRASNRDELLHRAEPKKPREQGIERVDLIELSPRDNSVVGPFEFGALSIRFGVLRYFEVADVRQRNTRRVAKPSIGLQLQLGAEDDPNHAAARLFHELQADLHVGRLAVLVDALELNVADDLPMAHYEIITASVEFRAEHFDLRHFSLP